jgi:prefoldin subunit 5
MSDAIEVLLKALQTEIKKLRREKEQYQAEVRRLELKQQQKMSEFIIGGIDDVTTK